MNTGHTVSSALLSARQSGLDKLDSQVLLLHCVGRSPHDRAWLIAHDSDDLATSSAARFFQLCQRRTDGEPIAYLIGSREFHGLRLRVDARVLDPRPDTETLVDWALAVLPEGSTGAVLDLGTGSGAIALAIQRQRPTLSVWASDASQDALTVAQENAAQLGLPVQFCQNNWLHNWPPQDAPDRFCLLVSNPPYIRDNDPHLPALRHEPLSALTSGADGLDAIRTLICQAAAHLEPGGWLLLEHGWDQGPQVQQILQAAGFTEVQARTDLAGHWRCTGGQWR